MDLSTLQQAMETAPARLKKIDDDSKALKSERDAIAFFMEAVRILRVSWREADPGKYGLYLSCYDKDGRKAWPRELVDTGAVAKHVADHRVRYPHWKDYDVPLAPLAELRREDCPGCRKPALLAASLQQTYDGPGGDEWAKLHYAICAGCVGLFQLGDPQLSSGRF